MEEVVKGLKPIFKGFGIKRCTTFVQKIDLKLNKEQ